MKPSYFLVLTTLLGGLSADGAGGAPVKIELPPETAAFKFGPGSEIANGHCLTCHSVEYVSTQPAMPRTFWAGSVKKMQDKYGAQIPPEQVERLVDYLTGHYSSGTNAPAAPSPTTAPAPPDKANPAPAAAGPQLALQYGCLGCHNVSVKIVGPPYRDIAAKYKTDAEANRKIAEQIHQGGSGKWGPIIMPPFPQVNAAETKTLTEWILGQK